MGIPRKPIEETKQEIETYQNIDDAVLQAPPGACRRMIFIDGPNVIHSGGESGFRILDIKGQTDKLNASSVLIFVYKLLQHGFEVVVLMKKFFDADKNSDNFFVLDELRRLEVLRFAADGLDDDQVLLRSAGFYGGAVISRDKFRQVLYDHDLYREGKSRSISYRISQQKFEKDDRHKFTRPGAMADLFCNLQVKNFHHAYATPDDPDFNKVQRIYDQYQRSGALEETFSAVSILTDFLQIEYCMYSRFLSPPRLPYIRSNQEIPAFFNEYKKIYTDYIEDEGNKQKMIRFHQKMFWTKKF